MIASCWSSVSYAQPGVLVGMGRNDVAQLGGSSSPSIIYTPIKLAENVRDIVTAKTSSFLIFGDDDVSGTGFGPGVLHDESFVREFAPYYNYYSLTEAWSGISQVSAGRTSTIVLTREGLLLGRGTNKVGQFGTTPTRDITNRTVIAENVVQASTSGEHTVWVDAHGSLFGAGYNRYGQVRSSSGTVAEPVVVMSDVLKGVAVGDSTFIIKTDGSLWGMGRNTQGQLGLGHKDEVNGPMKIADDVTDVTGDDFVSAFLKRDGSLWGMGRGESGNLGAGALAEQVTPILIATGVQSFDINNDSILYVDHQGNAWAMGENIYAQLATDDTNDRPEATQVMEEVKKVSMGEYHSLFLKMDASLWGVGHNGFGQLGQARGDVNMTNVRSMRRVRDVAAAGRSSFILRDDGTLWGAGYNDSGLLGTKEAFRGGVRLVDTGVQKVSTGGVFSLVLKEDKTVWHMGVRSNGTIGVTPLPPPALTTQIASNIKDISAGNRDTFLIDEANNLWGSGFNPSGQLGLGSSGTVYALTLITADVESVSAGESHAVFLRQNGEMWGMGKSRHGIIGTNTIFASHSPIFIADNVAKITAGLHNTYYITTDQKLMGLGLNDEGQLSDNPPNELNAIPLQIAEGVTAVSSPISNSGSGANAYYDTYPTLHVVWIDNNGTLWGSGNARFGQLGEPMVDYVTTPRRIAEQVTAIATGYQHTVYTQVPDTYLSNLSTRVSLKADSGDLITGFVISGTEPMEVLVRAVGPTLADYGVAESVTNPSFRIFDRQGQVVGANDDWSSDDGANLRNVAQALGAFALRENSADAAALVTLNPGAYTVRVERPAGSAGSVLLELYKRDPEQWRSRLMNLSVRTETGSGDDTLIAGFVTTGSTDTALLMRAVGPTLTDYGVTGTLADPKLSVFQGITRLEENDNWAGDKSVADTAADVGAFALPNESHDAATIIRLAPGAYTAQVSGRSSTDVGQALVEVYAVDE